MHAPGLEGITVVDTAISRVDGERGELVIGGCRLEDLAGKIAIPELISSLWGREITAADLGAAREAASAAIGDLGRALQARDAMTALRAAVAQLPSDSTATEITAAIAVFAAAWFRRHRGLEPVIADPSLDHAEDLLRMIRGNPAHPAETRALGTYLTTVVDHGMNASTFAARVVISTRSDRVSAVCAAIGALKGPLHGGAPGPVLDALDAGSGDLDKYVRAELAAGRRIMGMGHRVYRVRDPRAEVLARTASELAGQTGRPGRVEEARELERVARAALVERYPDRSLCANVELYTAVLLDALGIDRSLFSAIFAAGRVIGWCAHVEEEARDGRLIRPRARYVGVEPSSPPVSDNHEAGVRDNLG